MSNVIGALTGQNKATKAAQDQVAVEQQQIVAQQDQANKLLGNATSQQGQQLKLLSAQQATADNEAAQLNKPGIGRAMLQFQNRSGGGASTLGG